MKKIGLVGGLGPASTIEYYRGLTEKCKTGQGTPAYPEIVIDSVNMNEHVCALQNGDYEKLGDLLLKSLQNLKAAGAEVAAITANTEHIIWDMVSGRFRACGQKVGLQKEGTECIQKSRKKSH